jgi:hypothetical protein
MRNRSWAIWATMTVVAATTLAVSIDGARTPMQGVGLLAAKYPALAIGAMLCAISCAAAWWRRRLRTTPFDLAALAYAAACALSIALHPPDLPHLLPWLALQLAGFIVVAAACEAAKQGRESLLDGLVVIAAVVAVIAIYEAVGGSMPWDVGRRPSATFGNRNSVGGFCAIVVPLAVSGTLLRPSYRRSFALALLILAVLLCRARSSWMGLLVAGAATWGVWFWVWRQRSAATPPASARGRRFVGAAAMVAVVALKAVPWAGLRWTEPSPMLSSFSRLLEYESGTGRSRVDQHRLGIAMLAESPVFGLGPGSWRREAPRFVHTATQHHTKFVAPLWTPASDLLRHAVETGVVGLVAAAAMLFALLIGARARITDARDPVPMALMASLLVAVVISAFDAPLYRPHSIALIAVIGGTLRNECGRGSRQISGRAGALAILLSAGVCLAITVPRYLAATAFSRSFSAETVVELGEARFLPHEALEAVLVSQNTRDCRILVPAATLVDSLLPNEPENLWVLARCAEQEGRWSDAETFLERTLRLEPHDGEAARKLEQIRSRR